VTLAYEIVGLIAMSGVTVGLLVYIGLLIWEVLDWR
jgi:hypothetical protein